MRGKNSQLKTPKKIKKRGGRIEDFDKNRITEAVFKALEVCGKPEKKLAEEVTVSVLEKIFAKHKKNFSKAVPTIEEVQDMVEQSLVDKGFAKVAKTYILYRQKRSEIRKEKQEILNKKEIDDVDKAFDSNALKVLKSRYLNKNDEGKIEETPRELFLRVAIHTALPDILYDKRVSYKKVKKDTVPSEEKLTLSNKKAIVLEGKIKIGEYTLNRFHIKALHHTFKRLESNGKIKIKWDKLVSMLKKGKFDEHQKEIDNFYNLMVSRSFMPNTPTLANFGSYLGMGSACFALDIDDSMDSIMDTLRKAALIFKSGGGLGYNFSKLRPEGDFIKKTGGTSSGPLSFMKLFDTMTEVVKQGGIRRGANMGIMNSNHPDIEKFVVAKDGNKALKNFNISVLMMGDFWDYYKKGKPYPLKNPRDGKILGTISSKILFESIVYQAWESAEPGVLFHDRINEHNPLAKELGDIVTTNPCGELLLYPDESCNLGSINLWRFVKINNRKKKSIDWDKLEEAVRSAVRFLDNIIDINAFPMAEIEEMTLKTRKIGLGIMGLGDLLFELRIPYNSKKGRDLMEKIAEFINYYSKAESMNMAKSRGVFPLFKNSSYAEGKMPFAGFYNKSSWNLDWKKLAKDIKKNGIRNSYTTVIAPTGSISMIAGCSSGIEPVYSLVFQKNVAVGKFYYIDSVFERAMLAEELFDDSLVTDVLNHGGSSQKINYIPPALKKVFVVSHDIKPEDHVRSLASFQKWVDSSISKTINFPKDATIADMKKVYMLAYELGCKGTTVYRDGSIKDQVLSSTNKKREKKKKEEVDLESLKRIKDEKAEGLAVYRDPSAPYVNGEAGGEEEVKDFGKKVTHCPNCEVEVSFKEGCLSCPACGWGLCS